ncbi:MAG: hypothetical protein AXA67_11905 [Methylothermaceae bacteria B42]|nr:MAG: hypothetical protein AXA67_11905 [Methylothermaceae bacteria B42]HHJ39234.1 hypothetical protein [Methylothermaceae bacterium]
MKILPSEILHRIEQRFARLYGSHHAPRLSARLAQLLSRYPCSEKPPLPAWNQTDAILTLFADSILRPKETPLHTLRAFLRDYIGDRFSCLHLQPFFEADEGEEFAIVDHRRVDPRLGEWGDVEALKPNYALMFDLVLNQVSRNNVWFRDYVDGIFPARGYFVSLESDTNLSKVESPFGTPALSCIQTRRGQRYLWNTFGGDQFDLDFSNPDVLFELLDIMLGYVSHGASILQLDSVPFLWKDPDRCSVDLEEDHELVKIFRDVLSMSAPEVLLLAEAPISQNRALGYFGEGDESHLLYTHALGGLLIHGLLSGRAEFLHQWLENLPTPPPGCTFVNQTDDPNGIALKPLQGLLPPAEFDQLVHWLKERGACFPGQGGGHLPPFEANISFFDALSESNQPATALAMARLLGAQTLTLALKGIPGIHFPSLVAAHSDHQRCEVTNNPRAANRPRWQWNDLIPQLEDPATAPAQIFTELLRRIEIRRRQPAFHPDAPQHPLHLNKGLFGFRRVALDGHQTIAVVGNFTADVRPIKPDSLIPDLIHYPEKQELLSGQPLEGRENRDFLLEPYQTIWVAASIPS